MFPRAPSSSKATIPLQSVSALRELLLSVGMRDSVFTEHTRLHAPKTLHRCAVRCHSNIALRQGVHLDSHGSFPLRDIELSPLLDFLPCTANPTSTGYGAVQFQIALAVGQGMEGLCAPEPARQILTYISRQQASSSPSEPTRHNAIPSLEADVLDCPDTWPLGDGYKSQFSPL